MMTFAEFAGDPQAILGLLDSGPMFDGGGPNVAGVCDEAGNSHDSSCTSWAKEVAQPCPFVHQGSNVRLHSDDPPCPCDRWRGDLECELVTLDFRSCLKSCSHQGLKSKAVSFENTVDVFGFDPASPADAFPEEWWVDVVEQPSPASYRASPNDQGSAAETFDPYLDFWSEWCRLWQPVQKIIDSNGPDQSWGGWCGRFDVAFNGFGEQGASRHRNEGGLAVGNPDPRLIDPRAYVPEVPEDLDSDDDLGVSFRRWVDVIRLTDLHPYRHGGSIPFITYGLRRHHLGRRDFSSPDLLPGRIKELVWNLWQNEVGRFEQVVIHFVRPQPVILLIEILCDDIPPGSSPALAVTCDTSHRLMDSPKALYVDRAVDVQLLMPHFGLSYLCAPRGFRQCTFTVASALIGAYFVPVPEGALIKMIICAKLRIFAQAFEWFPDLERFAAVVRENVRRGIQEHSLVLHCSDVQSKQFGFRIGQLLAPPQLRVSLQQLYGCEIKACYPVDHGALNAMLGTTNDDFHALVYLHGQPLDHAFLVVTGRGDSFQDEPRRQVVVCVRDSFRDLDALHLHLLGGNPDARAEHFTFQHDGKIVHDLHAIPFGSVILHSVVPAPNDDTSMYDGEDVFESEDLSEEEEFSDDELSLLQTKASWRSVLEWCDRQEVPCKDGTCSAELLIDPFRPDGFCDAMVECVWSGKAGEFSRSVEVLRLPCFSRRQDVIQAVCIQVGCLEFQVARVWVDGTVWKDDAEYPVVDGAFYSAEIQAVDNRLQCSSGPVNPDASTSGAKIFTFVCEVDEAHRRLDIVAVTEKQALARVCAIFESPVQITRVHWDPSHLEPCRNLYVVSRGNCDSNEWPTLFVLGLPAGQQVWQVCHIDIARPLQAVRYRFPKAVSFQLRGNGHALTLADHMTAPGMCILCDTVGKDESDFEFSFTAGMQKLLHWMSSTTEPVVHIPGESGGEVGAAPCQSDRWCAAPSSHAFSGELGRLEPW